MSNNSSLYHNANSSAATLRPRNARLISYVEDEENVQNTAPSNSSTTVSSRKASPLPSRSVSPFAALNRAKSVSKKEGIKQNALSNHNRSSSASLQDLTGGSLWDWSSIQGFASTILGSEGAVDVARKPSKGRKPTWMKQDKTYGSLKTTQEWGPETTSNTSSDKGIEERQAMLQAKRREALLLSSVQEQKDALGRYKRKNSTSDFSVLRDDDHSKDMLVYRHVVEPQDTLAGVTIKYSCQPAVFRKINRFWPNDNIQRRTHVLLPVEACTLRGRKIDGPRPTDLLADTNAIPEEDPRKKSSENGSINPFPNAEQAERQANKILVASKQEVDEDFQHESWVSLPSFSQPVEILRVSRQILGYFPPARRKSNPSLVADSATSTPKSSFDMLRHPPTHAAQQAQLQQQSSLSVDVSPAPRPLVSPRISDSRRARSSSTASAPNTSSDSFLNAFRGPGGVGTLRGLRSEVARPGPGDDSLNKKFAQYIPDLLPPEEEALATNFARSVSMTSSLRATPRASTESARSGRSNSSAMPATIESWMKKIAGSGPSSTVTSPLRRRGGGHRVASSGSMGDLIELEVNNDSYFDREFHDEELTPRATPALNQDDGFGHQQVGSRHDEQLLNDRFPVRGRVTRAYEADS